MTIDEDLVEVSRKQTPEGIVINYAAFKEPESPEQFLEEVLRVHEKMRQEKIKYLAKEITDAVGENITSLVSGGIVGLIYGFVEDRFNPFAAGAVTTAAFDALDYLMPGKSQFNIMKVLRNDIGTYTGVTIGYAISSSIARLIR